MVKTMLEEKGYELVAFHTIGPRDKAFKGLGLSLWCSKL